MLLNFLILCWSMSKNKTCLVPCTWKWHPINSNRILLGLAASAAVGQSLNPESSPPSLVKAFSLMTLQRWEKVAAQKDLEGKGGIDPGTRPSFLSLTPASSSFSLQLHLSLCQFVSSPPLFKSLSLVPAPVLSGLSPSLSCWAVMCQDKEANSESEPIISSTARQSEETTQSTLPDTKGKKTVIYIFVTIVSSLTYSIVTNTSWDECHLQWSPNVAEKRGQGSRFSARQNVSASYLTVRGGIIKVNAAPVQYVWAFVLTISGN